MPRLRRYQKRGQWRAHIIRPAKLVAVALLRISDTNEPMELPYDQVIFLAGAACSSSFAVSDRVEMVRLLIADTTAQNLPPDAEAQRDFYALKQLLTGGGLTGGGLTGGAYQQVFDLVASLWTRAGHPGKG